MNDRCLERRKGAGFTKAGLLTVILFTGFLLPSVGLGFTDNVRVGSKRAYGDHGGYHKLVIGARMHSEFEDFADVPYDAGDLSYTLMYEYHDSMAFWQLGIGYAPESEGDSEKGTGYDSILTPQISLMFKDSIYRIGLGALTSYVTKDDIKNWSDPYYQVALGIEIPIGRLGIGLTGYYVFNAFENIGEFDDNALDLSAGISLSF